MASCPVCQCALVVADDIRLVLLRVGLEKRRPVGVPAGERPDAEVDAQLLEPSVGVVAGHQGVWKLESTVRAFDVKEHLLEAAPPVTMRSTL
jgi:hypothetical protein